MEEKSASVQGCGKLLAGLQSRSLTGYLLWYIFPIQLVFERPVNVFFVPLFVYGHDGVWNLFEEISTAIRQEILDWYHLKENLYKVGGSLKRLKAAETFLCQLDLASALFVDLKKSLHKILSAILKAFRTNR